MSAEKLATVMMVRDGEVQKRPYPVRIVEKPSDDGWFLALIIGFMLGAALTHVALLTPL